MINLPRGRDFSDQTASSVLLRLLRCFATASPTKHGAGRTGKWSLSGGDANGGLHFLETRCSVLERTYSAGNPMGSCVRDRCGGGAFNYQRENDPPKTICICYVCAPHLPLPCLQCYCW